MTSKKVAQRIHARRRLQERYNISLNRHQIRDIVAMVKNAKGVKTISRQSLRTSVKEVTYQGHLLRFVYDHNRGTIVTFLPLPESQQENHNDIPLPDVKSLQIID